MLNLEECIYTKFLIICFYIHIKQGFLWFQPVNRIKHLKNMVVKIEYPQLFFDQKKYSL